MAGERFTPKRANRAGGSLDNGKRRSLWSYGTRRKVCLLAGELREATSTATLSKGGADTGMVAFAMMRAAGMAVVSMKAGEG